VVLAVGQRVFIHSLDSPTRPVALGDESGALASGQHLIDGVEVEVMAWRPRGPSDTRYRVRASDGVDGWLAAGNLRKSSVRVPLPPAADPPPPSPPARTVADRGRRFGERI
jgi:hypothetical protein